MKLLFQPSTIKMQLNLHEKITLKGHWQQVQAIYNGLNSKIKSKNTYFHKNSLNQI